MENDFLRRLSARYSRDGQGRETPADPLESLLAKYRQFRTSSVIDGAAAATALSIDQLKAGQIDPLAEKAIHATNPHFNPWAWHDDAEWQAIVNSAKGKYFEYWTADQLNQGHAVGDLVLPSGYKAVVADSMNQPGWDLRIVDDHGHVQDYLQLKVTNSASYIHEALTRYPDIKILATSDVADHLANDHVAIDAGMTEDHLRHVIDTGLDHHDSVLSGFWDHFHPVLPLVVIAGMQLHSVAVGKQAVRDAIEVANARGQRALVTTAVGALAKLLGLGWFSIPAALFAGYWFTGLQTIDQLVRQMQERNRWLRLQGEWYGLRGLQE
jgi:hypothetical protein